MANIYINDIGTVIEIDMGENISTATGLVLEVQKPDLTRVEWTPIIYGTNYLRYSVVAGDLDKVGKYLINPKLTLSTWIGRGNTISFEVLSRFK